MLYPKEDRTSNTLLFACRTCDYAENAGASCIYRNSLKETIAETPGNVQDVAQDPTVGNHSSDSDIRKNYSFYGQPPGEDVLMGENGEEEEQIEDSEGVDGIPDMCTLSGQEILCPVCGGPTDQGIMLETQDPEAEVRDKGQGVVDAEKRERTLSRAGL